MNAIKLLTTGRGGNSGSWKIRGEQLGAAVGRVIPQASVDDCRSADVVVGVKRIDSRTLRRIQDSKTPWIWDLVDFYPQPACGRWSREYAIDWARSKIESANPNGLIYATERMKDDIGLQGIVIPHHCRPGVKVAPVREKVKRIGYDGGNYLGEWLLELRHYCKAMGWEFRTDLQAHQLDIVVALRGEDHNGYCQRHWKSHVKMANAHGAGVPLICAPESGYIENQAGQELWVRRPDQLIEAFWQLSSRTRRQYIHTAFLKNRYSLDQAAEALKHYAIEVLNA